MQGALQTASSAIPTFWGDVASTLIGTVAGFALSLVLFYLTEKWKQGRETTKVLKGLRRELAYDLALINNWLKEIEDCRVKVASGNKDIYTYLDYTRFLSIFIGQALRDGILYDRLNDQELVALDNTMRSCNPQAEANFSQKLQAWKDNALETPDMSKVLEFNRFVVNGCKNSIEGIIGKIRD